MFALVKNSILCLWLRVWDNIQRLNHNFKWKTKDVNWKFTHQLIGSTDLWLGHPEWVRSSKTHHKNYSNCAQTQICSLSEFNMDRKIYTWVICSTGVGTFPKDPQINLRGHKMNKKYIKNVPIYIRSPPQACRSFTLNTLKSKNRFLLELLTNNFNL